MLYYFKIPHIAYILCFNSNFNEPVSNFVALFIHTFEFI